MKKLKKSEYISSIYYDDVTISMKPNGNIIIRNINKDKKEIEIKKFNAETLYILLKKYWESGNGN